MEAWNKFIDKGDKDALATIYFHYYDRLFTFGLKHTPDKQTVEDSIQTVFFNLIQNRKGIGKVKNLTAYLMGAFRHQLFYDLAKQKNTLLTNKIQDWQFDYYTSSEQGISEKENFEQLYQAVRESIGRLPPKQQEIIFLRFDSGVPYEEIADMLHISVDSCYKSVYRSVKRIREEVEKTLGKGE